MVVCKYQRYRPREKFINKDKDYDRIMASCVLTGELCPAQMECEGTDQFVLSADLVRQCSHYKPLI